MSRSKSSSRKPRRHPEQSRTPPPPAVVRSSTPPPPPAVARPLHTPTAGYGWLALCALVLALCALVVAGYFPALSGGFLWDDAAFTMADPVQQWDGIWKIWFDPESLKEREGHYWPLLYSTFWLEHKLYGFDPFGFHLTNLLMHMAVTVLLAHLLRRCEVPAGWVIAALFAIHPVHVEAVAWIIGRKDMLAALCALGSALAYIRFCEARREYDYLCAIGLFVLALFSKSMAVTLPAVLLLWHWWRHGRITRENFMHVLPFFAVGIGIAVADWYYYKGKESISFDYNTEERVLIAARALGFYVGKLVWPAPLAVIYTPWEVRLDDLVAWGCLLAAITLGLGLWYYRAYIGRGPLAAALFFVVVLSPTLGFVDYGYMQFSFMADRYQYLACAGPIALMVAAGERGLRWAGAHTLWGMPPPAWRGVGYVAVAALVLAFGTVTWRQASLYQAEGRFFQHIIDHNPAARGAHHNLGDWHHKEGRMEEALVAYKIAIGKRPDFPPLHNQTGIVLDHLGRIDEAESHYREALRYNPRYPQAMNNLALLLTRRDRFDEALELFDTLLKIDPFYAHAYIGMGVAQARTGRFQEAIDSFDRALALAPGQKEAIDNRALVIKQLQEQEQRQQQEGNSAQ